MADFSAEFCFLTNIFRQKDNFPNLWGLPHATFRHDTIGDFTYFLDIVIVFLTFYALRCISTILAVRTFGILQTIMTFSLFYSFSLKFALWV